MNDALHQGWTCSSECLNAPPHNLRSDRLADLNAHRSVSVGHDSVKLSVADRAVIDIEAAGSLSECLDWLQQAEIANSSEVDKSYPALAIGGDLALRNPSINAPQLSNAMSLAP